MNSLFYFGVAMLAGMVMALACALKNMINTDPEKASDYPGSEKIDNKITEKRLIWMFIWILQGLIGGFVVALLFADFVFKNDFPPAIVWALALIFGSVSWLDFKKSLAAIKELRKFGD